MRYATVALTWGDRGIHPVDDLLRQAEAVTVTAVRDISPLPGSMYLELLELRGDVARAEALLESSPDVLGYNVAGTDERAVASVRFRSVGLVDDLLAVLYEHEIVLEWPLPILETGSTRGLEVTVVGSTGAIERAVAAVPDGIGVDLRRIGAYDPTANAFARSLTARQRELLAVAIREGYYEVPRRTTQRELAETLDLATGTVSEHLQRIEAALMAVYAETMR
ncbi:helix-turn-helix domain-containing protein [Natronobiforma cellulositropha]|uniref:helix-turn-helix domain-containing protein n=1 Tax=Natronobiforma cellulositropha TaxID=1679076 RepID=UPI0021D56AB8|nr:helix-turn-helix domain-containing protein [Natronobiforma cellulositropha]